MADFNFFLKCYFIWTSIDIRRSYNGEKIKEKSMKMEMPWTNKIYLIMH